MGKLIGACPAYPTENEPIPMWSMTKNCGIGVGFVFYIDSTEYA